MQKEFIIEKAQEIATKLMQDDEFSNKKNSEIRNACNDEKIVGYYLIGGIERVKKELLKKYSFNNQTVGQVTPEEFMERYGKNTKITVQEMQKQGIKPTMENYNNFFVRGFVVNPFDTLKKFKTLPGHENSKWGDMLHYLGFDYNSYNARTQKEFNQERQGIIDESLKLFKEKKYPSSYAFGQEHPTIKRKWQQFNIKYNADIKPHLGD